MAEAYFFVARALISVNTIHLRVSSDSETDSIHTVQSLSRLHRLVLSILGLRDASRPLSLVRRHRSNAVEQREQQLPSKQSAVREFSCSFRDKVRWMTILVKSSLSLFHCAQPWISGIF